MDDMQFQSRKSTNKTRENEKNYSVIVISVEINYINRFWSYVGSPSNETNK